MPFYRYPNRKADDVNYDHTSTTYNTILLTGKSKVGENLFEYQDNLLPTYPKLQTDKVAINYLYGLKNTTGTDSFIFDYGPAQTITAGNTYIGSIDASLTATGTVTNLEALTQYSFENYSTYSGNPTVSFDTGNLKYSYTTTIQPDEISYEWVNGSSDTKNITSFPYSLTITESNNGYADDWINDFYVRNSVIDDYLLNTWPYLAYDGKYTGMTICQITEDLVTFPGGDITDFEGWTFSDPVWTCEWWKKMTSGTIVSVRFTDTGGVDVVEIEETWDGTNPITWEWNQTEGDLDSAVIYFNNGEFVSVIPNTIVNNQGDDADRKTLFFTLKAVDNVPTLTINYGEYTIDVTYKNCTIEIEDPAGLSDEIKIYKSNRYTYTRTDNNYTQTVDGDLEFIGNRVEGSYACKSYRMSYWQDGICIKKTSLYQTSGYSEIPLVNTPIKENDYFLVEYFDTDNNYHSGKIYIHPTNSKSNAYYSSKIYFFLSTDNILYGGKLNGSAYYRFFGHYTDTAITVGKLVCPNKYFLLWQDRLGSQQIQPFDKVDTYSEDIEGSEITNYYDKRSLYKVEIQPKWKLQTGWISDAAYRCYEGLFVSPWVKLYDGDSDILYDVILKDRNYTEKNFLNQGKLFNLEVTVEQTEKQNILY